MGEDSGSYRMFLTGKDESFRKEFQESLSRLKPDTSGGEQTLLQLCSAHSLESVAGASGDAIVFLLDFFQHECSTEVASIYRNLRGSTGFGYLGLVCGAKNPSGSLADKVRLIEKTIKIEQDQWEKPLLQEIQHLKNSSATAANQERCKQLQKWVSSDNIVCHIAKANFYEKKDAAVNEVFKAYRRHVGESNLKIRSSATSFSIQKVSGKNSGALPTKAPALHWTNWPLPEELQVTWRFRFLCGDPPEALFFSIVRECLQKASCEYTYQWTDGLFLQFDSVKLCIEREDSKFELSVRCDPEEIGESAPSAANLLWHFLAPYLHVVFVSLEPYPRIPYQIFLVPIGNVFFSAPISIESAFEVTGVLSAIENQKYSGVKMTEMTDSKELASSDRTFYIERCLPADLQGHLRTLAAHSKASRKASHPIVSLNLDASRNANLLAVAESETSASKRRRSLDGRRVSFGHVLMDKKETFGEENVQDATEMMSGLSSKD